MAHLHYLVWQGSTITIIMTDVDYNNDYEHEDDDAMLSLLVLIIKSSPGHLQTQLLYLVLITRQRQGMAEMM